MKFEDQFTGGKLHQANARFTLNTRCIDFVARLEYVCDHAQADPQQHATDERLESSGVGQYGKADESAGDDARSGAGDHDQYQGPKDALLPPVAVNARRNRDQVKDEIGGAHGRAGET